MMNRTVNLPHDDDNFNRMIFASVVLHVTVVLFFTVKAVFFPSTDFKYVPTVRVDLVGLPEKRNPDKPVLAPKPEEKVKPVEKPEEKKVEAKPVTKKVETKTETNAINKLKTLSAIEKLKKMEESSKPETAPTPAAKKTTEVVRGNVLSPGTALQGLNKIDFDTYIGSLDQQVKSHWALPEWMASLNLRAEITIKIDKTGQIIEKTFVQKSGNADFDSRVIAAIEQSNPFPPPPEKFIDLVGVKGITFAFPE